jgi:hypothetical protein
MEAMHRTIPAPRASIGRRSRAAIAALALAALLWGAFALGRITAPVVNGPRSQPGLARAEAGAAVPRGVDVTYRPRHHQAGLGHGWMAGVPTTSGLMRPVPRHHEARSPGGRPPS